MSAVWTIARLTVRLLVRNRAFQLLLLVIGCVALVVFRQSGSDGELVNELRVRLQYSLSVTYALLTLMIMAIACFSVRTQLDEKQIHMLSSRPVSRPQMFLGQWAGVVFVAICAELVLLGVVGLASWQFAGSFAEAQRQAAWQRLGTVRFEARPTMPELDDLVAAEIRRRQDNGELSGPPTSEMRELLIKEERRKQQLCPPGESREWFFELPEAPGSERQTELRFKYYTGGRPAALNLRWQIEAEDSQQAFETQVVKPPERVHIVEIPSREFPDSRRLAVRLTNESDREIILGRTSGVRLRYVYGGWAGNVVRAAGMHVLHLATVVSVGMMAGVAFTFSVASFVSLVLFLSSMSAGFFRNIARELASHDDITLLEQIAVGLISMGQWITGGMRPPDVVQALSTGLFVSPFGELNWLLQTVVYCLLAIGLGCVLLDRKELSKLQA